MARGCCALGDLGDCERMREWIARTILLDPDNIMARYNLSCALAQFGDIDGAIELLGPFFERAEVTVLKHSDVDPDLDSVRADPRFHAIRAKAGERLGLADEAAPQSTGPSEAGA